MKVRYPRIVLFGMLALLLVAPAIAVAQESLDTPSLAVVASGQGKMRVAITAGSSGTPGGFTISWMTAEALAALGGIWPDSTSDEAVRLGFSGAATLNTWGETERRYQLEPYESLDTEIGDLTDETGVVGLKGGELAGGVEYVFRVSARPGGGSGASSVSPQCTGTTRPQGEHCTFTQGYWKSHQSTWPVSSLTLGSVGYTKAQLANILLGWSIQGNGLVSLAHQLIATKLNLAGGANPSAIAAAIADADALIGALVVPPVGSGYLPPRLTSALTQNLDDFNNGVTGPGHCGTVSAAPSTWGALKGRYR
jgi:hypothetical protein